MPTRSVWKLAIHDVVFCSSRHTLEEACEILVSTKFRRLPVIDESDQLVGMLTIFDFIRAFHDGDFPSVLNDLVKNRMNPSPKTICVDSILEDVINKMSSENIGSLPLVPGKEPILSGFVTEADIVNAFKIKPEDYENYTQTAASYGEDIQVLTADQTLQDALETLHINKAKRLLVKGTRPRSWGILTATDITRQVSKNLVAFKEGTLKLSDISLEDYGDMGGLIYLSQEDSVIKAIEIMKKQGIGSLPLIQGTNKPLVFTEHQFIVFLSENKDLLARILEENENDKQ
ncbi:MAG: CBS domain-containing protein [Candidatus Kariarchaeaceae archaeon]